MSRFLQWLTGVKKNEVKTFSDEDIEFNNLIKMIDDDIIKIESGWKSENVELKLKIHYGGHMFDKYDHVRKEIAVIFAYIKEIIEILHSTGLYSAYMLEDELYASYSHYDHICPDFSKPEHWYSMSKKHYRLLFSNRRYVLS